MNDLRDNCEIDMQIQIMQTIYLDLVLLHQIYIRQAPRMVVLCLAIVLLCSYIVNTTVVLYLCQKRQRSFLLVIHLFLLGLLVTHLVTDILRTGYVLASIHEINSRH